VFTFCLYRFSFNQQVLEHSRSRGSSVNIVIRLWVGRPGFYSRQGFSSFRHRIQTGSEAHPTSYTMGIGVLSLGTKRPGREADHSPPSSAEVTNAWSYISTPHMSS
jgi:hypothetical protein